MKARTSRYLEMDNSFLRVKFAFRDAVERRDTAMLKTLINNRVGTMQIRKVLSEERFDGFTALQKVCLNNNKEAASLFIEFGVDTEQRGKHGWSALHAAAFASNNDLSLVRLLLNSCADVLARDDHGCLPVDLAEYSVVRELLLNRMADKGQLELAAMYRKFDNIKNQSNVKVVEECDESTKDIRAQQNPEPRATEIANNLGLGYFYTSCEQREKILFDRPFLRRERDLEKRRVASWNFKNKRDSGISVDEPENLTYI